MTKVSVIIPLYNVELYIERCLHSLFGQTLDEMEFIFIDDGSTDASVSLIDKVIKSYPHRVSQTKIIRHNENIGVAAARTTGIVAASGDYIIHCDADDYIEPEMYKLMYNHAKETNSDIVACYYMLEEGDVAKEVRKKYGATPQECLSMINCCRNAVAGTLWDKMVRAELIHRYHIVPYEKIDYTEDYNCVIRMFYYAKSISLLPQLLYHHCKRENSMMSVPRDQTYWDMRNRSINAVCSFLESEDIDRFHIICNYWRFDFKLEYRQFFKGSRRQWFNFYRQSHKDILYFNSISLLARIFLWLTMQNYYTYFLLGRWILKV